MQNPSYGCARLTSRRFKEAIRLKSKHFFNAWKQFGAPSIPHLLHGSSIQVLCRDARLGAGLALILSGFIFFLMASFAQAAEVTLAWYANGSTAAGYRVYQRSGGQGYNYTHPIWPTDGKIHTETTCTIAELTPGVVYYFVVRAHTADSESGDSNEVPYQAMQSSSSAVSDANNHPPIAEAGANRSVTAGDTVGLYASGSSDPDGDAISCQWTQKSGPSVTLSGADAAQCWFKAPHPDAASATLAFELKVTDSKGLIAGDTCLILVTADQQLPGDGGLSNPEDHQTGSDPIHADENLPPERPIFFGPVNEEIDVALSARLRADGFNDPNPGDRHTKTQWRITLTADTRQIVMDLTSEKNHLTELQVPNLILDPSTHYSAQVRFFDSFGEPSAWSSPVSFTTGAEPKDKNENNIPDAQEVPADTDMNGDATRDFEQQAMIKSMTTYNARNVIAVSIEGSDTAAAVAAVASIDPTTLEYISVPEERMPLGLIGYKIRVTEPGESTRATIHLSNPVNPQQTQWVRYSYVDGIQDCTSSTIISDDGLSLQRYLIDGGAEDADGAANGVIVELSGPLKTSDTGDSSLAVSTDGQAASGGNSAGCFIHTLY